MCSIEEIIDRSPAAPHPDDLRAAIGALHRLEAHLSLLIDAFDRTQQWDLDGAKSMANWLITQTGTGGARSRHLVSTARDLRSLPATAAAWRAGDLTSGQVQLILGSVSDRTRPLFADAEGGLLPALRGLGLAETRSVMRAWAAHAEASLDDADPAPEPPSVAHLSSLLDGRARLDADLDSQGATIVAEALRLARRDDTEHEPTRTGGQRTADALVDICRFYLAHRDHAANTGRNRPHVNVIIGLEDLRRRAGAVASGGQPVAPATVAQWLCDAQIHRVIADGTGVVLDYGRAQRSAPTETWNALIVRDGHCRWPGCDSRPAWCEAHHVVPWEAGGATDMANLVLLCRRHHTIQHREGWSCALDADATFRVTDPRGAVAVSRPARALRDVTLAA